MLKIRAGCPGNYYPDMPHRIPGYEQYLVFGKLPDAWGKAAYQAFECAGVYVREQRGFM